MHLIIGGAYQGKREYAIGRFDLQEGEIFNCAENGIIDFSAHCLCHIDEFVLWCVRNERNAVEYFTENAEKWIGSILICTDIFCGVVPIDPEMRLWREATGRLLSFLGNQAESVTRIFCSLPQVLK